MDKKPLIDKTPSLFVSLIPITVLATILIVVAISTGGDILAGGSQIAMLVAAAVAASLAMGKYRVRWRVMEERIIKSVESSTISILVLLFIGAISGTWMLSGVVPTMIYYGLEVLHPVVFLPAVCVISAVVSLVTGSSWTTCATIGVAFMGIGYSLGFPAWWTAGAVISGAYFGDKMSPLSDTTVLASSTSGVTLFSHIRYLTYTTFPSMILAIIIYAIAGVCMYEGVEAASDGLSDALSQAFNISGWLLVVPLFTFILILRRVPVLITLFLSVVAAAVAMLVAQPDVVASLSESSQGTFASSINAVLTAVCTSTALQTGNSTLDTLVATGGMSGMLNTIWLILSAMCFGGVIMGSGMASTITRAILKKVHGVVGAVSTTLFSGLFFNLCTADQYMSIILTSDLNKEGFDRLGIDRRVLSRATEDSATILSVLIPWNSCGIAQSAVLGISTLHYFPFCFFNLLSPIMSFVVAALGYKIIYKKPKDALSLEKCE